jgi:hypothetical protein
MVHAITSLLLVLLLLLLLLLLLFVRIHACALLQIEA